MKSYYFVSATGTETNVVKMGAETFSVDLLGKSYKSIKVISSSVSIEGTVQYSINLRLHSYTGNGLSSDRKQPILAMYKYDITADVDVGAGTIRSTDFYDLQEVTPTYYISESLNQLVFSFTGSFDNIIDPNIVQFEFMLEMEE